MRPAMVSGIVTGHVPVSYWSIFLSLPSNSPRCLCEVSFSFLKWRVVEHKRRPKGIAKIQNGGQKIGKYVKVEL